MEDIIARYDLFELVLRQTMSYVTTIADGRARIRRCYDHARTPLVRLLEKDTLSAPQAQALIQGYADTDPLLLLPRLRRWLDALVALKPQPCRASPSGNIPN